MAARSNVQNDLRIIKVASGQMTISFSGYRMPVSNGQTSYAVKVVPIKMGGMVVPAVTVDSFASEGIVLRVTDPEGKMLLPLKYLVEQEFSIEVAEIPPQ
jgi:hypothetical protein